MAAEDDELIRRYRSTGCRESLNELVHRHLAGVRAIVLPMVLDETAAEDVTQDVFLRAVRALETFNGHASFSTWLYRIAMNASYSYLAQRGRTPMQSAQVVAAAPPSASPVGAAVRNELDEEIRAALAELSPQLRAAIVLTRLEGKSPAEAAEIEGCPTSTIYGRVHRARQELKRRLARHLS